MEVRRATLDDLDALASLRPWVHDEHARAHPDNFKLTESGAARREAEAWLGQPNVHVLLATQGGAPVGYLRAEVYDRAERELMHARRILYLDQIAVQESDRGQGHGKRLIEAGVALARELGIGIVELDVYAFNAKARAFFLSQGFEPQRERLCRVLTDRAGR
jgi:ribosomal protein S18 acetylase RimI-like enzyme